jgi:heme/copper-type cytochrome/quinol oxidase subunit 3
MSAPLPVRVHDERPTRVVDDVASLPDVAFGPADVMWWGTLGFVVIEGFTLVLCAAVLVYLRQNFHAWPPEGTRLPSLGIPTAQVALMLLSLPVVAWMSRASKRMDLTATRIGTVLATLFAVAFVALRMLELTRSLLLFELVEIAGMALAFLVGHVEDKHFADIDDAGFYWYFMVLSWLPLYALCYWLPRWT